MSARGKVWLAGLAATAVLVGATGRDAGSRELSIPVGLLTLAVSALIAEATLLRSIARGGVPDIPPPPGARPADGVVEVQAVREIEAVPNRVDPRWRRFVRAVEPGPGPVARPSGNPRLLGQVCLISVFVGRDGHAWTDPEVARAHESLGSAGRWIEREASRRDARLNVGLADAYFQAEDEGDDPVEVAFHPEGDDVGPMEADASTKGVIGASRAAARLGFADLADMVRRVDPRVEADARVWLFHLRRAGRSLAIPAVESDVPGVGLAVCFAREASFPEPLTGPGRVDPTTVAHELLHLFGASDKYGVALRSFPPGSVTSRDVMRLNHGSLSRMTIDALTASEIGWGRPRTAKADPNEKPAPAR